MDPDDLEEEVEDKALFAPQEFAVWEDVDVDGKILVVETGDTNGNR